MNLFKNLKKIIHFNGYVFCCCVYYYLFNQLFITIRTSNMKNKIASSLFLFTSVGFLALQSCQKTGNFQGSHINTVDATTISTLSNSSSGGGGASGGGHNGGSGGGGTIASTDPSLAPTDTTTSQLAVADI